MGPNCRIATHARLGPRELWLSRTRTSLTFNTLIDNEQYLGHVFFTLVTLVVSCPLGCDHIFPWDISFSRCFSFPLPHISALTLGISSFDPAPTSRLFPILRLSFSTWFFLLHLVASSPFPCCCPALSFRVTSKPFSCHLVCLSLHVSLELVCVFDNLPFLLVNFCFVFAPHCGKGVLPPRLNSFR